MIFFIMPNKNSACISASDRKEVLFFKSLGSNIELKVGL